jgi:prepilin-type N-terminal cleavage/methylation domain-containing protein
MISEMIMKIANRFCVQRPLRQNGFTLMEFMVAMVILAIAMAGLLPLMLASITTDKKAAGDTTATTVGELVLEQISSQPSTYGGVLPNPIQDCANPPNSWNIDMTSAVVGAGSGGTHGGNGANLTSTGTVDWAQSYATIPAGFAMQYVACSTANDTPTAYDVRWDVIKTTTTDQTKMVVVSARPLNVSTTQGMQIIIPINLRTIIGM